MAYKLQLKRGLLASLPNGSVGEPLFTTDTFDLYVGKGDGTNIKLQKFIASGSSSQFLKGDGSLDSTTYQGVLSGSGIVKSTGGTISYLTDNTANWDAAYNDKINSASVSGTTTKTLTLTQQDGGTITASWSDYDTAPVTSVFGRTGAVVAASGDYTTSLVTEGTNLYFTDARARAAITLTTTGSSGSATYVGGTLNIPTYTLAGLGGVPTSRSLTINGTSYDLSADRSWSVGTVTSVDLSVPTGFAITGNPITSSGTLALAFATGYSLPTNASQTNWDAAYNDKINSASVTGTTTKTLTLNQQDGGTITASWTDINTDAVTSVFGRTGAVVAASGDYTTTQITEGTNLYYTEARVSANTDVAANTAARHSAVTLGTANGLSLSTQQLSLALASGSTTGALSSSDWTTFNSKQAALNGTGFVKISGTTISYDNSTYYLASNPSNYITLTSLSGTSPISYNNTTGAISISQASGTTNGFLSSTDWTTFNNKQSALTNPVTGTGTTNYLPKFTGSTTIGNSLVYDNGSGVVVNSTNIFTKFGIQTANNRLEFDEVNSTNTYIESLNSARSTTTYFNIYNRGLNVFTRSSGTGSYVQSLTLNDSGSLGIGTTSPAVKLDVVGQIRAGGSTNEQLILDYTTVSGGFTWQSFRINGSNKYRLLGNTDNSFTLYSDVLSSSVLTVASSGNLGLGVTPSAWNSTFNVFQIGSTGSLYSRTSGTEQTGIASNAYFASGTNDWRYITSTNATYYLQSGGVHYWLTAPSGTAGNAISFTQAMTLTSGGKLLLGVTSIAGSGEVQQVIARSGSAYLEFQNNSTNTGATIGTSGENFIVYTNSGAIGSETYTERFRIASTGAATFSSSVTAGAFIPSYNTSYYATDGTISNYSATNYMYVNGTGGLRLKAEGVGYQKIVLEGGTSNDIWFTTANSERLRITSGGNVGIGTSSPASKLQVEGGEIRATTSNAGIAMYYTSSNGELAAYNWGAGAYLNLNLVGLSHTFQTSGTERMRITSGGSVGINTSSPSQLFTVVSTNNNTSSFSGFYALNGSQGVEMWYGGIRMGGSNTDVDFNLSSKGAANLVFNTNSSERMRITSGGDVLINSTFVVNSAKMSVVAASGNVMTAWQTQTSINNGFISFGTEGTFTERGYIYYDRAAGQVKLSATSDARLKNNIIDAPTVLNLIDSINVRQYEWKETGDSNIGFVAQELYDIIPRAVAVGEDNVDGSVKRYWGVDNGTLVPYLVKAIQELKAEIEQLKNK